MKARPSNPTLNPVVPVVLFGLDQHGKPKAARFPEDQAGLASKAAEQLKLRVLRITGSAVAEIAAQLPFGRIHANGKGAVPNVRVDLYTKLVAAADESTNDPSDQSPTGGQSNGKPPNGGKGSADRPTYWDEIRTGQKVLAHEDGDDDWYDVEVVERTGDMCTLRWRDYPRARKFVRHCRALALLYPNAEAVPMALRSPVSRHPVQAGSPKAEDRAKPAPQGLPPSWDEIEVGHLVLAKDDGPYEAWWPAIPTENHGETLTLRWRDYAQLPTIVRPRLKLALMYPGSN